MSICSSLFPKVTCADITFSLSFFLTGSAELPFGAWLVGRKGSLSAGVQYKPLSKVFLV